MSYPTVDLVPTADVADTGGPWTVNGAATFWDATNEDDTSTTNVETSAAGTFSCEMTDPPAMLSVISVFVRMSITSDLAGSGQVRPFLEYGGVQHPGAWHTISTLGYQYSEVEVPRADGLAWTPAQIKLARLGFESGAPGGGDRHYCSWLRARVTYIPAPAQTDASRDLASRRIWLRRRTAIPKLAGPPEWLDYRPGDRVRLCHILRDWDRGDWERRPLWVERVLWDPVTMRVTLSCRDHRDRFAWMYDSGYATAAGVARDGLMRISAGCLTAFSRASTAEMLDATGQLVSVPVDTEALAARGQVFQEARENLILNSAFALGIDTNWTSAGEGSNGSSIFAEAAEGLWTTDLAPHCLSINAGSPVHAADLEHVADTIAGLTGYISVAIWHKDYDGLLSVGIQRSVDSKWYRASDQTWQVAKTWNDLTGGDWRRDVIRSINVGAAPTDVQIRVGLPTATAVAAQTNLVAQVQVEACQFPGSPILTLEATVTRAADEQTIENNLDARTLCASQFTLMFELEPFWSLAEQQGGADPDLYVAYVEHDGDNHLAIYYCVADTQWKAELRVAGVDYVATLTHSPVADTRYLLTVKFSGVRGENGTTPYTLSIDLDGTAGTSVVASGPLEEVNVSLFYTGCYPSDAARLQFGGYIRQRLSSPQVLTADETARGI